MIMVHQNFWKESKKADLLIFQMALSRSFGIPFFTKFWTVVGKFHHCQMKMNLCTGSTFLGDLRDHTCKMSIHMLASKGANRGISAHFNELWVPLRLVGRGVNFIFPRFICEHYVLNQPIERVYSGLTTF